MAKINGMPTSIRAGIPKLPDTPVGWKREKLSKHLFEIKRPISLEPEKSYRLVTVKRSRGGVEERSRLLGREIKTPSQFITEAGDFLISKRQIVHGACGIVPDELTGSVVSNEYTVIGTKGGIDLTFLRYLSESMYFQQTCFHSSIGVHVEKMIFNVDRWLNWHFNVPPVKEQKKIVEILSVWDKALETIEVLINNSKKQNKSLKQRLLTGKQRLPGFTSKWRSSSIKEMGKVIPGGTPDTLVPKYWNGDILWTTPTDITNLTSRFISSTKRQITQLGLKNSSACLLPKGSVLVCTRATICELAIASKAITTNQGFKSLVPNKDFDSEFIYYLFGFNNPKFVKMACGSTFTELSKKDFENLKFIVPEKKEQIAIAQILSCADDELTKIDKMIELLKTEKQSLLQQLLTGKRRVNMTKMLTESARKVHP